MRARLLPGQLVLRPRKRLKMSEPVPVEPVLVVDGPDLGSVVVPQVPEGQVEEGTSDAATTVEIRDAALFAELAVGLPDQAGFRDSAGTVLREETEDASESTGTAWRAWTDLILHKVPQPIVAELARRGITITRFVDAYGDLNLDYYPVKISKMPSMNGLQFDPETLLAYIRRHIDTCVDTSNSSFPPLDPALDKPRWMSDNPLGAVINIQINTMRWLRLKPRSIYADQGLVVALRASPACGFLPQHTANQRPIILSRGTVCLGSVTTEVAGSSSREAQTGPPS